MKNFKISCFAVIVLFLSSCNPSPTEITKKFTENLSKGKIEEAKKYASEGTEKMLDFAGSMGSVKVNPDFEFHKIRDSISDKRAWVTFKDGNGEATVELAKIDGKWIVVDLE